MCVKNAFTDLEPDSRAGQGIYSSHGRKRSRIPARDDGEDEQVLGRARSEGHTACMERNPGEQSWEEKGNT